MSVRRYQPTDEVKINQLFEKVFKQKRTLKHWNWKFHNQPNGHTPWILVYEEGEEILGHISLWVQDAFIHGGRKKIGLRIDTMVDPDARGKGIYRKLNETLISEASKENIDFLYGFPAPKAKDLFIKYTGASHMIDIPRYVKIIRPVSVLSKRLPFISIFKSIDDYMSKVRRRKQTLNESANIEVKEVTKCGEEFDKLAENTKYLSTVSLIRDSSFLNWRFLQHPEKEYRVFGIYMKDELTGYYVINKTIHSSTGIKSGMIVDYLFNGEELIGDTLVKHLLQTLHDVDVVQTWALPESKIVSLLRKNGFIHKDSPMPLVGVEIEPNVVDLRNHEKWYVTPGDVDSF